MLLQGSHFYSIYLRCCVALTYWKINLLKASTGCFQRIMQFSHGKVKFSVTSKFLSRYQCQGQDDGSRALATRISLYVLVPRPGNLVACLLTIFALLCTSLLNLLRWKKTQLVCLSCRRAKFLVETDIGLNSESEVNW